MSDRPTKILVVDDTPGNRYAVVRILRAAGYTVIEGVNGADALRLTSSEKPDLLVLDVKLPDMLGFEATERLRASPETMHVTILHVSASYTGADAQALGLGKGADGYLVHPIEPQVLIATVGALLRLRHAERRAADLLAKEQKARAEAENARALAEQREQHYRFLADMIPQIVWTAGPDGAADYFNRHWFDASGLSLEDSLGWGWTSAIHADDVAAVLTAWRSSLATGKSFQMEYRMCNVRTDRRRWSLGRAEPLRDASGCIVKWFGTSTDIEDQKRAQAEREELFAALRRSEARLQRLWSSGLVGILYWTMEGPILDANDAFLAMVGYPREDLAAGRINWRAMTPPEWEEADRRAIEALRTQGLYCHYEKQYMRKDGSRIDVLIGGATFENEPDQGVTIALDISERKRFEAERSRLLRELEEALRARDEFLAIVSHDLKGPISAMSLNVDRLLASAAQGPEAFSPELVLPRLHGLAQQIDLLVKLLEDLLDISRMASGKLTVQREEVDLAAVARSVVERLAEQARACGSELRLDVGEAVLGLWDRIRLDQVITNLLTNALKYGAGNPVEIRVDATPATARLMVRDRGVGIAPEDQERIFKRFERAQGNHDAKSFGLGLWIVQRIVDALGGTIEVNSEVGKGSTFTVELPRFDLPAADWPRSGLG